MFCPKCGTRVADDDYACYMCGSRLNNDVRSALDILIEKDKKRLSEGKNLYDWEKPADRQAPVNGSDDKVRQGQESEVRKPVPADDPIEATVQEMFEQKKRDEEKAPEGITPAGFRSDASEAYNANDNEDVRHRGGVPAALVIVLLLAACIGGALWWFNRPSAKISEAIEVEDIETVTELYDKLPTEEKKEEVKVSMIERARKLCDDYINEDITYDEVMNEYDALAGNVLEDSDEFEELNAKIERINDSRRAFEKAEKSFMHGEYREAIDAYKEVIEEDERYYGRAQENIPKCNAAVADQLIGKWAYEYDARKEVEEFIKVKGFSVDLSKMKIPITFLFDIRDDETIEVSVDYDALDEYVDKILDLAVDAVNKGIGTEGLTSSEVSNWIKYMYGATGIKDSIKSKLNFREALDNLLKDAGMDKPIPYRVEDGRLYIGETGMDPEIKDDVLTLTSGDGTSLVMGNYEMTFPVKMKNVLNNTDNETKNNRSETDENNNR